MNRIRHGWRIPAALVLILFLLPTPAFALRKAQDEAKTSGLEETLRATGLEAGKATVRILMADTPQRETVPNDIRVLIHSMQLDGLVELIEERGDIGDQQKLKALIERYDPAVILIFAGRKILMDPYVVHAAHQHGVRLVIRAGAGYENISMEAMTHYGVPFLRSHGLGESMTDFTLRFMFAGLRLRAGTPPDPTATDVSAVPELSALFQMSPAVFHEALDEALKRKRGEMTPAQKERVFGPLSHDELLALTKSLAGQKIGLLGFGVIGEKVVRRLNAITRWANISCEILAAAPSLTDPASERARVARDLGVHIVPEQELLQTADILTVHIPSTDANRRHLTPQSFSGRTKPLILINTAREDLIDRALLKEPQPFQLTFLGDVDFDPELEALRAAHPDTFILTPHMGGLTSASAQGAIDALLGTLRTTLPVLLGRADPGSIQTLNGIPVVPVVSKPGSGSGKPAGLEENDQAPARAAAQDKTTVSALRRQAVGAWDNHEVRAALVPDNPWILGGTEKPVIVFRNPDAFRMKFIPLFVMLRWDVAVETDDPTARVRLKALLDELQGQKGLYVIGSSSEDTKRRFSGRDYIYDTMDVGFKYTLELLGWFDPINQLPDPIGGAAARTYDYLTAKAGLESGA